MAIATRSTDCLVISYKLQEIYFFKLKKARLESLAVEFNITGRLQRSKKCAIINYIFFSLFVNISFTYIFLNIMPLSTEKIGLIIVWLIISYRFKSYCQKTLNAPAVALIVVLGIAL